MGSLERNARFPIEPNQSKRGEKQHLGDLTTTRNRNREAFDDGLRLSKGWRGGYLIPLLDFITRLLIEKVEN